MGRLPTPKTLGGRIKMYREKKFWDIDKTAKKAGIKYITYIKIENDKSENPTISNVVKIARALRVSIDDLTKYSFWEEEKEDTGAE